MHTFTLDDLKLVMVEHVGLLENHIPEDPDLPVSATGMDSLAVVEVQLALHSIHGITFPEDDDDALGMITLSELVGLVNDQMAELDVA
jgi:acyl carrier protein